MSEFLIDYRTLVSSNPEKPYKTTLFQGDTLFLGLNCLEPGQEQTLHTHAQQDKFYFVLEGQGEFCVADQLFSAGKGRLIWAAAGLPHAVRNQGKELLVVLMCMAPGPGQQS